MNNIGDITFIYSVIKNACYIQADNQPIHELTIKGACEYQGEINGTWFQIDELTSHWISFRWNLFNKNKWEVFYKRISYDEIKYYRRLFYQVKGILVFSFSEEDEWFKDSVSGKWKNKF